MLKASAGGGGKGMRAVWKKEDLKEAIIEYQNRERRFGKTSTI